MTTESQPTDTLADQCVELALVCGVTGLVYAVEHLGLWDLTRQLDPKNPLTPLLPYTLGTATLASAATVLALRWKMPMLAITIWALAGTGGTVIGGLRLYRRWRDLEASDNQLVGHGAGLIDGTRNATHVYERRMGIDR